MIGVTSSVRYWTSGFEATHAFGWMRLQWGIVLELIRTHRNGPPHPALPAWIQTPEGEAAVAWAVCIAEMGRCRERLRLCRGLG